MSFYYYLLQIIRQIRKHFLGILLIIAGLLFSCVTVYETINNRNFADEYNPANQQMHPEFLIYMRSQNEVFLYFRFFPKEFAFMVFEGDSVPQARVSLFFRVTNSYTSAQIIDSLTSTFNLRGKARPQFLGFVPVNLPADGRYVIEVFLTDLNVHQTVSKVIDYNHSLLGNSNSYMFISQYGNPLFHGHFSVNDTFRVRTEMFGNKPLKVSYYKPDLRLPVPPDIPQTILLEPQPVDSTWEIQNPDTTLFSFKNEGVYYFTNTSGIIGKPYSCFNPYFPYLKKPDILLKPLAYICTEKEMKKLKDMESEKGAVDTFWIQRTNDLDKSRELIRVFYNRVQLANYFFTDYKEGWLTDRGMFYIICGAPAHIQKTDEGELWSYGKGNSEATKFFFYREKHPIFGTTYILDRSDLYSRMWFNAISTWRDGRVFSLNP